MHIENNSNEAMSDYTDFRAPAENPESAQKDYRAILGLEAGKKFTSAELQEAYKNAMFKLNESKYPPNQLKKGGHAIISEGEYEQRLADLREAHAALVDEVDDADTGELVMPEQAPSVPAKTSSVPANVNKQYLDYTPAQQEQFEQRSQRVWAEIQQDPQLKSVLAYVMLPEGSKDQFVDARDDLSLKIVDEFYMRYPTLMEFVMQAKTDKLPGMVADAANPANTPAKQEQYRKKVDQFAELMYLSPG